MTRILLIFFVLLFFTLPLFAQSVDTAWVRRYNGPANSIDYAAAIAIDSSGNVYVTGWSTGIGTSYDYATIKYYPDGDTAWVRRYNGPDNRNDLAHAIAVDASGNVYVTGESEGESSGLDFATIKYDLNGDTVWVRRLDGQGSGWGARDLAIDGFGNVLVTGACSGKFATVKYYPDGDTAWVRKYAGPSNFDDVANAIAVDDSGNVYVTGESWSQDFGNDYATMKYFPNGDTAWIRRFSGQGSSWDVPDDIEVDKSGNSYVTGTIGTIKYDNSGNQVWNPDQWWGMRVGREIAVDDSGNAYVAGWSVVGGPMTKYTAIKYLAGGDTGWVRVNYGSAGPVDQASGVAIDASRNVYVTGTAGTIKYSNDGESLWTAPGAGSAIALNYTDDFYVTGTHSGSVGPNYSDYSTIKYVQFLRGDVDNDKQVTIADIIYLISYLLKGGPKPTVPQAGDANCDKRVSVSDVVYLINYLLKGGAAPCR